MAIWDPVVEFHFKHTGSQSAGEEYNFSAQETSPDEVLEIFRIEVIPPVSGGSIQKLRYITLNIGGEEHSYLRINSIMSPAYNPYEPKTVIDLGVPYLWRPLTGKLPEPVEATCPKIPRGTKWYVKTVAHENISEDYEIIVKAVRCRGLSKLISVVGTSTITPAISLAGDLYTKSPITIGLDTWDELPGGLAQEKPMIFPWIIWVRNKASTTANEWYSFEYDTYVQYPWQDLWFNLVNKEKAYLIEKLGVITNISDPTTGNLKYIRFYIEGRETNPQFYVRPLGEFSNFIPARYYQVSINSNLKSPGPTPLLKPFLLHGVKGGIQIKDNGTSISANTVELHIYGKIFVMR